MSERTEMMIQILAESGIKITEAIAKNIADDFEEYLAQRNEGQYYVRSN